MASQWTTAAAHGRDYGNGSVWSLLRKTVITFNTSLGNIVDHPATVQVRDGNNNLMTEWEHPLQVRPDTSFTVLGRWVERKFANGTYDQGVYAPHGGPELFIAAAGALRTAYVPLSGQAYASYNTSGLAWYQHSDWLGTGRLFSSTTRTVVNDFAVAPYMEQYINSAGTDTFFTGVGQSAEAADLKNFPARLYQTTQGRWITPDPAGLSAVDLTNPQTFNRYGYAGGDPLNTTDPTGLDGNTIWIQIPTHCYQTEMTGLPGEYQFCEITFQQISVGPLNNPGGQPGGGGGSQPPPKTCVVRGLPGSPCPEPVKQNNPVPVTGFQFCSAGVFAYGGRSLDAGPVNGFAGVILEADSSSGVSRGALFELGGGEGYMGGVGKIVSPSAKGLGDTNLVYGGVGGSIPGAHAAGGGLLYGSGAGLYGEISAGGREIGIGGYLSVAKTGGCSHP